MKRLALFFIIVVACFADLEIARGQTEVVYGYPGDDDGYEVTAMQDGGFMVGGHTNKYTSQDYWAVRFSNQGKVLWDSAYGSPVSDFLWSVQPTRSGGALLAGYSGVQNSGLETALLFAIDSVGRTIKKIDVGGSRAVHAHWFAQRKQGGYFWSGHTDSDGDTTGDMILQKLNDNFDTVWQRTYGLGSAEHAHCGTLTNDGGCVLLGHTSINGYDHFWATRIDSNGNQKWSKVFQSSPTMYDSPYGVVATKEGGFALLGGSQNYQGTISTMWLVVVDSAGNKIVDKHYGSLAFAYSGIQAADGSFMLIGYAMSKTKNGYNMDVVRTDAKGNQKWEKRYGTTGYVFGYGMFEHNDQYVLVGSTDSTSDGLTDLLVVYVDSNGTRVPYDSRKSSDQLFAFTVDSSNVHYQIASDNHATGTVENLSNDSLFLTFKRTSTLPKPWEYHVDLGGKEYITDSSRGVPYGFALAPHEKQSFLLHAIAGNNPDSGTICVRLSALNSSRADTMEQCFTLLPPVSSGVSFAYLARTTLSLSPNPIDRSTNNLIEIKLGSSSEVSHAVYDALGREVSAWTPPVHWSEGSHTIELKNLIGPENAAGQYFVRFRAGSEFFTAKLIVR